MLYILVSVYSFCWSGYGVDSHVFFLLMHRQLPPAFIYPASNELHWKAGICVELQLCAWSKLWCCSRKASGKLQWSPLTFCRSTHFFILGYFNACNLSRHLPMWTVPFILPTLLFFASSTSHLPVSMAYTICQQTAPWDIRPHCFSSLPMYITFNFGAHVNRLAPVAPHLQIQGLAYFLRVTQAVLSKNRPDFLG